MPKVHVTMFEDPIEVPEDEVPVLRAQGILAEEPAAEPAPSATATAKAAPAAKKDGQP